MDGEQATASAAAGPSTLCFADARATSLRMMVVVGGRSVRSAVWAGVLQGRAWEWRAEFHGEFSAAEGLRDSADGSC